MSFKFLKRRKSKTQPWSAAAQDQVDETKKLLDAGKWATARPIIQDLINKHGDNADVCWLFGRLMKHNGKADAALHYFEKCLQLEPTHSDCYFHCGELYGDLKRYDKEGEMYTQCLEMNPKHHAAHYRYACLCEIRSDFSNADKHFQTAIRLNNKNALYYISYGESLKKRRKNQDALKNFQLALVVDPESHLAYFHCSKVLQSMNRLDEAIEHIKKAIRINPSNEQYPGILHKLNITKPKQRTPGLQKAQTVGHVLKGTNLNDDESDTNEAGKSSTKRLKRAHTQEEVSRAQSVRVLMKEEEKKNDDDDHNNTSTPKAPPTPPTTIGADFSQINIPVPGAAHDDDDDDEVMKQLEKKAGFYKTNSAPSLHNIRLTTIADNEEKKESVLDIVKESKYKPHVQVPQIHADTALQDDLQCLTQIFAAFLNKYDSEGLAAIAQANPASLRLDIAEMKQTEQSCKSVLKRLNEVSSFVASRKPNPEEFEKWNVNQIIEWIESLDNGIYGVYSTQLRKAFTSDGGNGIGAAMLPEIDAAQLGMKPFNIEVFQHRIGLAKHFRSLGHHSIAAPAAGHTATGYGATPTGGNSQNTAAHHDEELLEGTETAFL